ncbi:MAG: DUF4430 domain-containing protein [Patescibacteria group bacterium]
MTKVKKLTKLILPLALTLFLAASCNQQSATSNQQLEERQQIQVSHLVEGVDRGDQLFNFYADENKTALDLLRSGHSIETKTFSGVGEYVISVDGKKEDTGKNFWALYVNGEQSQVGASDYKPKDKDKIVWKLEEIK